MTGACPASDSARRRGGKGWGRFRDYRTQGGSKEGLDPPEDFHVLEAPGTGVVPATIPMSRARSTCIRTRTGAAVAGIHAPYSVPIDSPHRPLRSVTAAAGDPRRDLPSTVAE